MTAVAQAPQTGRIDHQRLIKETLWPWQRVYLTCGSRWVIVNKSRNTGYTWVGLLHAVLHCLAHDGHTYFLATLTVDKAKDELVAPIRNNIIPALARTDLRPALKGVSLQKETIRFANGSTIKAAANEVDHLRGPTRASYLFDECASWAIRQHKDLREAVYPIVRSEGMNPHGTLRMVSTPRPIQNLYRKTWEEAPAKWNRQGVDIIEACACEEYPDDDPDQFREDCDTEDEYRQEYLRVFLDAEGNYFDRHELESLPPCPDHKDDAEVSTYVGIDIGRKNDLTAIVAIDTWAYEGEDHIHVWGVWLLEDVKFSDQEDVVLNLVMGCDAVHASADQTAHPAMVEHMQEKCVDADVPLTPHDIEGTTGDRTRKVNNTQSIQGDIEDGTIYFDPVDVYEYSRGGFSVSDREVVIDDLCKVEEQVTAGGNLTYDAPRDDDGHADSYSALLQARHAMESSGGGILFSF